MKKIGFFGLGIMGASMASNLLKAGFDLVVYNRTICKAEKLKEIGATVANNIEELLAEVEVCCSCVTDSDILFDVVRKLKPGSKTPKYWIDFSTIAPSAAVELHKLLKSNGTIFIDSPVTGGDVGARNASLAIMVGSSEEQFCELLPILNAVGKNIVHVGQTGSGQLTKCVNQMMCAISIAAMSEGLYFAEKQGLNIEKTLQIVKSGAAGSWALENYAPRLLQNNYAPGFYAKDQLKDLNFVISEANSLGLNLPVTSLIRELFDEFVQGEGKDLGNHALIKAYRA